MDLGLLATFLAVARHRSLTEAARELGLTQPGVSRRVQRLEQELGVALLERRGDGGCPEPRRAGGPHLR